MDKSCLMEKKSQKSRTLLEKQKWIRVSTFSIYNFILRNHLFCLINANNKLKITTTKNIVMSFKPYTEKIKKKKFEFVRFRSDPDPEQDPDPDPSSRKRIRGSGSKLYGSETLEYGILKSIDNNCELIH